MRKRATQLDGEADAEQTTKSRRFKKGEPEIKNDTSPTPTDSESYSKQERIPFIPKYIVNAITDRDIRSDLLKWRTTWNKDGREMRTEESSIIKKRDASTQDDHDTGNEKSIGKKRKNFKKKSRRLRRTKCSIKEHRTLYVKVIMLQGADETRICQFLTVMIR